MSTRGSLSGLYNVLALCVIVVSGKIKLVNNGYEGVTIAISSDVAENDDMLARLEMYFTNASATLFRATNYSVYFREFIIIIPEHWGTKGNNENANDSEIGIASFIIDKPNSTVADNSYTRMYLECGSPGFYIHFTSSYIQDDDVARNFGPRDQVIVHEWAHYRWGVFDEYAGYEGDSSIYIDGSSCRFEATRCSEDVKMELKNFHRSTQTCMIYYRNLTIDKDCRFVISEDNKAVPSLMFAQDLTSVKEFCDDNATAPDHLKHNRNAPNMQNRLCKHMSVWGVMRKHPDFAKENIPLPVNTNTTPTFRYVKVQQKRRVLVLDASSSMRGEPLTFLRQAASSAILSTIESGSQLAIVKFSTSASILSQLQPIGSDQDRSMLIDLLPNTAGGWTSIGSGLKKGIESLNKSGSSGGSIILITDGKENTYPLINVVKSDLKNSGIVVHTFAFSQNADQKLANLSRDTGGSAYFFSGQANSTGLMDGFAAIVYAENRINSKTDIPQPILTEAGRVTDENPTFSTFYIDTTIGRETSVTIAYTEPVEVRLKSPTAVYSLAEFSKANERSNIIKLVIPGEADVGMWSFNISTEAHQSHVTVNIQSKSRKPGMDVVQVTSWIPEQGDITFDPTVRFGFYADVLRGQAPVLNAQVLAIIERPQSTPLELFLYDNGVGIDIIKNDGIYSAAVMAQDLMGDGRYNIKVNVIGIEGQVMVVVNGGRSGSGAVQIGRSSFPPNTETAKLENFQRVTTAGEFSIQGFPSSSGNKLPDQMAPARITDLRLASFDFESLIVKLQWTTVGDDMERGTATEYQIHTSEDFDQLMFQTDQASKMSQGSVLKGNLSQPHPSGTFEEFELQVQPMGENTTILLGVMAVDESGNRGDMSNLVTLSIVRELYYIPSGVNNKDNSSTLMIYLAITVPLAVMALMVVLGIIILMQRRKKRSETV